MAVTWHLELIVLLAANLAAWWRGLRLPFKLAVGASMLVLAGMVHLGMIVTGHIRENVLQQSASAAALYMDSFVARHVQELATNSTLSDETRLALERLLSPAAMHRPVVAFRIWKGDTVVFSNEHDLISQTFARTDSRERAWQGHVAVVFGPDGDDDEQVRSLKLPVLEIYAPVRQAGTGRIIALVETYEIAVELKHEVWVNQLSAWVAVVAITLTVVVLLFSMLSSGTIERNFLLDQMVESERRRKRIGEANLQVCAMNERSLRSVGNELNEGPGQYVALALLKFDALEELVSKANGAMPLRADQHKEDLEVIHKALNDALRHIRRLAGGFPPADIEDLSLEETFGRAATRHERRTGVPVTFESHGLPEQLPFPLKASLYRFALEGLASTYPAPAQNISAFCANQSMVLKIVGARGTLNAHPLQPVAPCPRLASLRDRIEALGGRLKLAPTPDGGMSLVAELSFADMELASG